MTPYLAVTVWPWTSLVGVMTVAMLLANTVALAEAGADTMESSA